MATRPTRLALVTKCVVALAEGAVLRQTGSGTALGERVLGGVLD
jgi:hypothetical protein